MFAKMIRRVLFVIRSGLFLENRNLKSLKMLYAEGVAILFHFVHIKREAAGRTYRQESQDGLLEAITNISHVSYAGDTKPRAYQVKNH
jgi:hypothetical protein